MKALRTAAAAFLLGAAIAPTALAADPAPADEAAAATAISGEVAVFAASSLRDAFTELAVRFSERHTGARVAFNFAGSQQLAAQILEQAPADVFAAADNEQMRRVADGGHVRGAPQTFAANLLEIAVERSNPQRITGLADLARPGLVVVMAAPEVPAGRYGAEALKHAGVTLTPASFELNVRSVLSKVAMGEADAGIVYHSDLAASAGKVEGVTIPPAHNVRATYPIAALNGAYNPAGAAAFVALVLSDEGRDVLIRHGFEKPRSRAPAIP